MELEPGDVVPANLFDLAGRTVVFTPNDQGEYSRTVGPLEWDPEDRGERYWRAAEVELKHFQFQFSGRKWHSFFIPELGRGHITFGREFPSGRTPARFGTMRMIADAMVVTPTISALYKPYLGGYIYVSDLPDRVAITFNAWDYEMAVYGRRPKETFDYQIVLHADGRVAFNYRPDPSDPDEAFRDGVVGLFPTDLATGAVPPIPDQTADLSQPDTRFSAVQMEVFHYPAIRDRGAGVASISCRIIEVLGDEFDFFAFNSQSRVDAQEHGPAHGFGGYYWGNISAEVQGIGLRGDRRTPCESRLKTTWGFPVWMKAGTVVNENYANDGHDTPYDEGLTYFAHEIAHTWLAYASYLVNGERTPMQVDSGVGHWALGLHAPAPFSWDGASNGSVMGGAFWRENVDGTFSPTVGWWTKAGGFSWLDLYLMGLAAPGEVPDMFILRNLQQVTSDREGPYTGEKETITIEQIIAAIGPRDPPAERAPKAVNMGFVYFLLPGETLDPELIREHAQYRDRALDHWRHITGGRGQLTTELHSSPAQDSTSAPVSTDTPSGLTQFPPHPDWLVPIARDYPYMHQVGFARVYSDISAEFSRDHALILDKVFRFFSRYYAQSRGPVIEAYYTLDPDVFREVVPHCPTTFIPGARNLTACYGDIARWFIIPYQVPDFGTLKHEIGHDFLFATFSESEAFPWFKEGTAMYFEGGQFDASGDLVVTEPLDYCTALYARDMAAGALIALDSLLWTPKRDFLANNESTYSQSCMFVHYLADEHPGVLDGLVARINRRAIDSNDDLVATLLSLTQLSINGLEDGLRRYAAEVLRGTRTHGVGPSIPEVEVVLETGWTLVEWPGAEGASVPEVLEEAGVADEILAVYQWDEEAGRWLAYFPGLAGIPGLNTLEAFRTGAAYWVAVEEPTTWKIPGVAGAHN